MILCHELLMFDDDYERFEDESFPLLLLRAVATMTGIRLGSEG